MHIITLLFLSSMLSFLNCVELVIADNAMVSLKNSKLEFSAKVLSHTELRDVAYGKDDRTLIERSLLVLRVKLINLGDGRIYNVSLNCKNGESASPHIITTGTLDIDKDDIIVIPNIPHNTNIVTITWVSAIK